jgi:hypothetical protein
MTEATSTFEMSVNFYQTTWHVPEDSRLQLKVILQMFVNDVKLIERRKSVESPDLRKLSIMQH